MSTLDFDTFATPRPKPRIPSEFYRKSLIGACGLIGFMLAMFIIPTALNYYLLAESPWPLWIRLLLCMPLFVLAGQAIHLMGWIGHDGFHFTFHENRHVSAYMALLFSSMTLCFFNSGMALDHWSHHRFANTDKDPDLYLLSHYKTFWGRLLRQRNRALRHYFVRALNLAMGRPLPQDIANIKLPFSLGVFRVMAWANVLFVLGWLGLYIYIETRFAGFLLIGVLIPLIIGGWLSGLRSFTEHSHTAVGDLRNTRSRTHRLFTVLECGGNYHLEHHLYPSVPQWRLPRLHRWLTEHGHYDDLPDPSLIDGRLAVYEYTLGRYEYGRKAEVSTAVDEQLP
jgi:beta-carotene hydroxylase